MYSTALIYFAKDPHRLAFSLPLSLGLSVSLSRSTYHTVRYSRRFKYTKPIPRPALILCQRSGCNSTTRVRTLACITCDMSANAPPTDRLIRRRADDVATCQLKRNRVVSVSYIDNAVQTIRVPQAKVGVRRRPTRCFGITAREKRYGLRSNRYRRRCSLCFSDFHENRNSVQNTLSYRKYRAVVNTVLRILFQI